MIRVKIIALGRLKEKYWCDAVLEYAKRLKGYCDFEIIELNPIRLPDSPNNTQIESALLKEAELITAKIPKGAYIIPMCIEGKQQDSEALARLIEVRSAEGISSIVFIIGSSFGLHDSVKNMGNLKMSMSSMTFPHQLARVMLCEQIYRAFKINEGSAYHK